MDREESGVGRGGGDGGGVWMALERVARGAGMEELAREVKAVRGFWQDGAKKDQ